MSQGSTQTALPSEADDGGSARPTVDGTQSQDGIVGARPCADESEFAVLLEAMLPAVASALVEQCHAAALSRMRGV